MRVRSHAAASVARPYVMAAVARPSASPHEAAMTLTDATDDDVAFMGDSPAGDTTWWKPNLRTPT